MALNQACFLSVRHFLLKEIWSWWIPIRRGFLYGVMKIRLSGMDSSGTRINEHVKACALSLGCVHTHPPSHPPGAAATHPARAASLPPGNEPAEGSQRAQTWFPQQTTSLLLYWQSQREEWVCSPGTKTSDSSWYMSANGLVFWTLLCLKNFAIMQVSSLDKILRVLHQPPQITGRTSEVVASLAAPLKAASCDGSTFVFSSHIDVVCSSLLC